MANINIKNILENIPISHVTNQFYLGNVCLKYVPTSGFVKTTTVNGKTGTNNFYFETFNNAEFMMRYKY